jgi:hypothetical protein
MPSIFAPRPAPDAPGWATRLTQDTVQWVEHLRRGPQALTSYKKADLPDPTKNLGALIWVSDDSTGAQVAVSDGTNWKRINGMTTVA